MERRKLFHVFLKEFLIFFKNWEPANGGQLPEGASTATQPAEYLLSFDDTVIGCSAGHPAEVILTLIEEVAQLTTWIIECKLKFKCFL